MAFPPFDDDFTRFIDTLFNGRPVPPPRTPPAQTGGVTIRELIRRGVSHVKADGKVYRIEAREMEVKPKEKA